MADPPTRYFPTRVGWGDVPWALACAAAGVAFALFLYALNHRAFFNDDTQEAFAPIYMAIGRSLAHGHWPALTLQMLNGGALAAEYQYALYNPFSLLACWVASQFGDQAAGETALVAMHYAVLGSGAFAFARAAGAGRPWSALAGCAFVANNFIYYWLAESWIIGLEGFAWFAWAMAFLMRAHASRLAWIGAALAVAMTVTAGCYHVVFILGMAILTLAVVRWRTQGVREAAAPLLAACLGVLLCLAAVLPLLPMSHIAARTGGLNNDGRLGMDLYGVLAPSSPFHLGHFLGFGRFGTVGTPIYFAAWWLLPLAPLIDWRRLGRLGPDLIALIALAGVFAVATQGPEQVFWVRFSIWYLAPLHLALLAAFAVVASRAGFAAPTRTRVWAVVLIVWFGWFASVQVTPTERQYALAGALVIGAFTALGVALHRCWRGGYPAAALGGLIVLAAFTHLAIRTNGAQLDRGPPTSAPDIVDLAAIPHTAGAFLGAISDAWIWPAPEIRIAAMPLVHGGSNPFGYSPFGQFAFSNTFGVQLWGTFLPEGFSAVLGHSPWGPPWLDLMRIDSLVVPRIGDRPAFAAARLGPGWRVGAQTARTVTFARRAAPARGPGSVAWTSPGLRLAAVGRPSAEQETLAVTARAGHGDRIVFDRVVWPGYRVSFRGAHLPLDPRANALMSVALPDGRETGDLTIAYAPPYAGLGLVCALLALVGLAAGAATWPRWAPGRP